MSRSWIAVASAEHVAIGRQGGFMQVCHGKVMPLRRIQPGDRVVYYSPVSEFGSKHALQAFTALGTVLTGEPYQVQMGEDFFPFRRDVLWLDAEIAPIRPLLDTLEFTRGKRNWAYPLRFGLLEISTADLRLIATAMGVIEESVLSL